MKHKRTQKPTEDKEPERMENELQELRQQLEQQQKEKDELFAKLQRVSADYANFQKRAPKQIADTVCYEKEKIMRTLLPILDNFEHTLQNEYSDENVQAIVKGVQIIYEHMLDILRSHGVEQINALGEKFDPSQHEAMLQKFVPDKQDNIVLEEFQKGYKLNGRVIRPGKVIVNKLSAQTPAQQRETDSQEQKTNENETTDESQTNDTE